MVRDYKFPGKPYIQFKAGATRALEQMLQYILSQGNDEFVHAMKKAEHFYSHIAVTGAGSGHIQTALIELWAPEIQRSIALIRRLKKASYVLSKTSENEALARIIPRKAKSNLTPNETNYAPGYLSDLNTRVELAYEYQASKIARAIRIGRVLQETPPQILARVKRTYPSYRIVKTGRKNLAKPKLREAEPKKPRITNETTEDAIEQDFYDDQEWNDMVDLYKESELWSGRSSDETQTGFGETEEGEPRYKFQFEQEATEDFVSSVRAGEIQAANDQGIDEFIWTAVLDAKTCEECCAKRDGLLTSEIEKKLNTTWKNDLCKAIVPPAHINCRCQPLPVASDFIPDQKVSFTGIDEWLDER